MNSVARLLVMDIIDRLLSGESVVIQCDKKEDALSKLRIWNDFLYRIKNIPIDFKYSAEKEDYISAG